MHVSARQCAAVHVSARTWRGIWTTALGSCNGLCRAMHTIRGGRSLNLGCEDKSRMLSDVEDCETASETNATGLTMRWTHCHVTELTPWLSRLDSALHCQYCPLMPSDAHRDWSISMLRVMPWPMHAEHPRRALTPESPTHTSPRPEAPPRAVGSPGEQTTNFAHAVKERGCGTGCSRRWRCTHSRRSHS